ncbi:unnamed protein product [Lactuca saligna]|uniref:Uncharacterized protein n=1 Tax=Lactuca saligna TaxID=75948 RepID=A0AA35ZEI3_LACSI|nr:unnamed protein product [Lactuca saligna]
MSLRIESSSSPTALRRPPIADDETGDQNRLPAVVMEENLPNILSYGLGSRHLDLNQKADLTLKEGRHLQFGNTEYILICGLKGGRYVDLLYDEKGQSNSSLRARLFPDISGARLRLNDLEVFIMSPKYSEVEDEDVVLLIQLVFVLKGLHEQDVKTCIPVAIYNLADNRDDWNSLYI